MRTQELRFPCAGCGKKTPATLLEPVMHGTIESGCWYIDKRCPTCASQAK